MWDEREEGGEVNMMAWDTPLGDIREVAGPLGALSRHGWHLRGKVTKTMGGGEIPRVYKERERGRNDSGPV